MMCCSRGFLLLMCFFSTCVHADSPEQALVIGTWGGPYEAAQRTALFAPFEKLSGIRIETRHYTGGLNVFDSAVQPDLLDMLQDEAEVACQAGLLKPIDFASVSTAKSWSPAANRDDFSLDDFYPDVFGDCRIAHLTYSNLLAYDERAFTGEKPARVSDLFDLERFPGKRALQRSPAALFEWAMMAEGVPVSQIYDLLSTERGLRLVISKLEVLRGQVLWWDDPATAVKLLEQGKVVMASGYNGRFFESWRRGAPISMIWDGQIIDRSVWAIPKGSQADKGAVLSFLRYALHPESLAGVATQIPYGPLRYSALRYIGQHPETGMAMHDHLPTADHHLARALVRDTHWYASTSRLRQQYFSDWMTGAGATADPLR